VLSSNQVKKRPVGVTRMGEKRVQGELPIIECRKRRQALIEQAQR
jgi:hypothetical protein